MAEKIMPPDSDRSKTGRLEISRQSNGRFSVFIGNAYGTRGDCFDLDADGVRRGIEDFIEQVLEGRPL